MKLSKSVMFGAAACLLSTSASAQAAGDLLALSQYNYSFSTARSAALGGAFTSLGADLSSMSINPAGLGMYMSSDFGISPSLTWNNMQSTYLGTKSDYSRTRFTLGNLGMAFNLYQGSGTLTSFTLGVGYSKLADFNTTSAAYGQGIDKSITDVLAEYMNGVPLSSLGHPDNDPYQPFRRADVGLWGGILAYQTGILDPMSDAQDNTQYTVANNLATGSRINPSMRNVNKGSIDEYSISGGFNIQNILYLGFTIGIQDILYRNDNYYAETYDNNSLPLNGMNYIRSLHLDGTGVNFKAGIVYRPTANLRLGAAIHTPTYYSLDRKFQSAAAGLAYANNDTDPNVKPDKDGYISTANDPNMTSPLLVDDGPNGWSFVSPTRLMFGASYTFGERGVISVDYERDWYNGIRIKDNPSGLDSQSWYNDSFRQNFKASNIVRVGAEFKPLPVLSLRAGFGYSGSMVRDDEFPPASPVIKQTTYYGAGVGFVLSRGVLLDLAYQYVSSKLSDYYLFYAEDKVGYTESALYSTDINRHNVALTLGFRF